jgi:hypothetical protein
MTYNEIFEPLDFEIASGTASSKARSEQAILLELIKVLSLHRTGLRRSSVMRTIRRDRGSGDIPQKFEDDVERVFRAHCADPGDKFRSGNRLFFRPLERAGEVWALLPEQPKAVEPEAVVPEAVVPDAGELESLESAPGNGHES